MAEGVGFDRLTSTSRLGRGKSLATMIRAYAEAWAEGVGFDRLRLRRRRLRLLRPARPPDALQYVGLFFLFVSGGLAFESHRDAIFRLKAKNGGGGGIRTHVAARTAKSISSRPRYGHFGTPPRGEGGIIAGGGRTFKHGGGHSCPSSRG